MGDSDLIPEMGGFMVDVIFVPDRGIFFINAEETAKAAAKIMLSLAITMHC